MNNIRLHWAIYSGTVKLWLWLVILCSLRGAAIGYHIATMPVCPPKATYQCLAPLGDSAAPWGWR